jgi:hypothetical protein
MCDPFSLTTLAISAASSAAAYSAQASQAKAQANYQNTVAEQTGQIAQQNYLQQTATAGNQQMQGQLQSGQALQSNQTAGLQANATASLAAAEGGVGGNTVGELLQDFKRQEAMAADNIKTNQTFSNDQIQNQELGLQAQAQGRIASSRPGPVNTPSALALGLSIGGSAFSAYNGVLQRNQTGPYDPNGNLQNQGFMFRPLPFLSGLLPDRVQPQGKLFSS